MKTAALGSLIFLLSAHAARALPVRPELDPALGKIARRCSPSTALEPRKHVWVFEQWHLPPGVDTRANPDAIPPQAENQTAIFRQLDRWIATRNLETVLAEGCAGEIDARFGPPFNGWRLADLAARSHSARYDEITSHVPLKLEAKFGSRVKTLCADDPELIRAQSLAFSDARAAVGYAARVEQHRNDPARLAPYLSDAIRIYRLPERTSASEAVRLLKDELRAAIRRVKDGMEARNRVLAKAAQAAGSQDAALVVGGAHVAGLIPLLESSGLDCTVVEPAGYRDDAGELLATLEELAR